MKQKKSPWVDYKTLKQSVSIIDVLTHFKVEIPEHQNAQIYLPCCLPHHAGDRSSNSLSVNKDKNIYRCVTHCGGGNVLELFCLLEGLDPTDKSELRKGALQMMEVFLGESSMTPSERPQTVAERLDIDLSKDLEPNEPLSFSLQTKADVPFLVEEKKISMEILEEFQIGYCSKGMFSGRITVPIHDRKGDLIAYAGRGLKEADLKKRGRWMFPKNFHKSLELFNQHRLDKEDVMQRGLVVVEGFWSVLRWHEAGYPVVGLMGCQMSQAQLTRIAELTDQVWLMLDNDPAGTKARSKILEQLASHVFVRLIHYPEKENDDDPDRLQPEDFTPDELNALIPA